MTRMSVANRFQNASDDIGVKLDAA